jgi:hypothetical protein
VTPIADLPELEAHRERLRAELAGIGDFRPGSLSAVMRRCGKPNCACADPDHPGHGPQYVLTRKVAGKTVTTHLRPGPELGKARAEVEAYKRFRQLIDELIEVNGAICAARPVSPLAESDGEGQREELVGRSGQKKGSRTVSSPSSARSSQGRSRGSPR